MGRFVNLILEDIHGCLINHQCPAVLNSPPCPMEQSPPHTDSSVFAKNLLTTLESRLYRFDKCECIDDYTQLRFRDMIEFLVKKNNDGELTWFCDMGMERIEVMDNGEMECFVGVYTKNRAFRLLRSSKFDKQECFTIAPENQWKPNSPQFHPSATQPSPAEHETFMASLVYFNG